MPIEPISAALDRPAQDAGIPSCPGCILAQIEAAQSLNEPELFGCNNCLDVALVQPGESEAKAEWAPGISRVGEMAQEGSVMAGILGQLREEISQLPALPEAPRRVLSTLHDPLMSMTEVAQVIQEDAVMSVKLLGISNSAYYARVSEVSDLVTACAFLGARAVANIAHTMAYSGIYKGRNASFLDLMGQLWTHGVASAYAAEELGRLVPAVPVQQLFLAGLTHDVGKLALLDCVTNRYKGSTGRLKESPELLVNVISRFSPIAGFHVVQHWKLPKELRFTTLYASAPSQVPVASQRALVQVVSLASDIADACGYSIGNLKPPELADHPLVAALGIPVSDFDEMMETLPSSLESVAGIFGLR